MSKDDVSVGRIPLAEIRVAPHNIRRDLGDLRTLADSIRQYGVLQPIVVEKHSTFWRLRAGHRRVAAAQLAGLTRIPAVIHRDVLDVDEWIAASVQENVMRRGIDAEERKAAAVQLHELGCSWQGIAEIFGVSQTTVRNWVSNGVTPKENTYPVDSRKRVGPKAVRAFVDDYRARADVTVEQVLDALEELIA